MSEWGKEIISNQSMVLMFGGLIIGLIAGEQSVKVMPLFSDLFYGVLALFLLEMGIVAAERIKDLKQNGLFLTAFSMVMPIINGTIGGAVGTFLGFSAGGIFLTIVLSASVSYIAVPLAMRSLLPTANPFAWANSFTRSRLPFQYRHRVATLLVNGKLVL